MHQSETTGLSRSSRRSGSHKSIAKSQAVAPVGNDWSQWERVLDQERRQILADVAPVGNDWFRSEGHDEFWACRVLARLHQSETTGLSRSPFDLFGSSDSAAVAPVGNDWSQSEHRVRLVLKPLPFRRTSRKRLVSVGARSRRPRTSAPAGCCTSRKRLVSVGARSRRPRTSAPAGCCTSRKRLVSVGAS